MPYEELSHSADWALHAWAADMELLFEECAKGMNALSGTRLAETPRLRRSLSFTGQDMESLLVSFLSELVFIAEQERLGFDEFELKIRNGGPQSCSLSAALGGARIVSQDKAIKAVTYHNLHIRRTGRGCEVELVFDV